MQQEMDFQNQLSQRLLTFITCKRCRKDINKGDSTSTKKLPKILTLFNDITKKNTEEANDPED